MTDVEPKPILLNMEITVTTMGGSTLAVLSEVDGTLTVSELTQRATKLARANGFELEKMQLTMDGRRLQAEELIGDLNLEPVSTLGAVLTAPGAQAAEELSHPNMNVRIKAAAELGKIGPAAAPYAEKLAKLLKDPDGRRVRFKAAESLGLIGEKALPYVVEYLGDADPMMRCLAAETLSSVGAAAKPHIPALVNLLTDKTNTVQSAAMKTLARIGPDAAQSVAALLSNSSPKARACAAEVLQTFGANSEPFATDLVQLFRDEDSSVRHAAVKALSSIGKPAAHIVAASLNDDEPRVRRCAAETLGNVGPAASNHLPEIEALLMDPRVEVQACARKALESIKT